MSTASTANVNPTPSQAPRQKDCFATPPCASCALGRLFKEAWRSTALTPKTPGPAADCRACRLTGAGAFTGLGLYSLWTAREQGAFARIRPRGSPVVAGKVTAAIGVVFLGLGIGRLLV